MSGFDADNYDVSVPAEFQWMLRLQISIAPM